MAPKIVFPASPVTPGLGARGLVEDEAFFPDEWGTTVLPSKLHENKYKTIGQNGEYLCPNPLLEPSTARVGELTARELDKLNQLEPTSKNAEFFVYRPPGFSARPARVTLLFAVGAEMARHGLRAMLQQSVDRVLVLISGRERGLVRNKVKHIAHPWGTGITGAIIRELLKKIGLSGVDFLIDIVACFSTGYRGMIGTINNHAGDPATLDLSSVKRLVVFDALYKGDEPGPGNNYQHALAAMNKVTGGQVELILYDVTFGGTPWENGDTRVPQSWLRATFGTRYFLIHLQTKTDNAYLFALCYARMFDAAVQDGYFPASMLSPELQALIIRLPPRNTVTSVAWAALALRPKSMKPLLSVGSVSLADWGSACSGWVWGLQPDLEDLLADPITKDAYSFLCWSPRKAGEALHDMHIREFAWEFLA